MAQQPAGRKLLTDRYRGTETCPWFFSLSAGYWIMPLLGTSLEPKTALQHHCSGGNAIFYIWFLLQHVRASSKRSSQGKNNDKQELPAAHGMQHSPCTHLLLAVAPSFNLFFLLHPQWLGSLELQSLYPAGWGAAATAQLSPVPRILGSSTPRHTSTSWVSRGQNKAIRKQT